MSCMQQLYDNYKMSRTLEILMSTYIRDIMSMLQMYTCSPGTRHLKLTLPNSVQREPFDCNQLRLSTILSVCKLTPHQRRHTSCSLQYVI